MTTMTISIPPGVSDSETFAIRREGNRIAGQKGDLLVNVTVERSPIFSRKKNDIYITAPINLYQALLGGTIVVPTIDGDVDLKIPPGTQPDDIKRMSGRGIYKESTGERGHQFVKFKIEIPRTLTAEQRVALEKCFNPTTTSEPNPSQDTKETSGFTQWFENLRRWIKWY